MMRRRKEREESVNKIKARIRIRIYVLPVGVIFRTTLFTESAT